jgi:predicted Ser/Thr protein kinase
VVGRTIKHYEVEATLGKGGMGVVYRARDTRLNRPVALKFLPDDLTTDPERRTRFVQEARAASAVVHPAIAQVYDVDEVDEVDGGLFIAMEYVEGRTVKSLVRDKELDVLGAVEVAMQVGDGLAKAHESGIVHRDIKADNIMVNRDGHAKILDFGLAKLDPLRGGEASGEQDPAMMETIAKTQDGMILGTLGYMSPEQARGQAVDGRSDIFSLGVVLYEMATRELPFSGGTPLDTLHAIAFEETRPVTAIRPNLPPGLQRVVSRCLRKKPQDRYADARQLVQDLRGVQREIESGISTRVPLAQRLREGIGSLKDLTPAEWIWPAAIALAAIVLLVLALTIEGFSLGTLFVLGLVGLIVYRRLRNRRFRLMKRFGAKVRKMPEVRLIVFDEQRVTVVADKALAKTYVRVNALLDKVNERMFFGEPFSVTVRDDVPAEELRALLQGPGVVYVRDDVLETSLDKGDAPA